MGLDSAFGVAVPLVMNQNEGSLLELVFLITHCQKTLMYI